MPLIFPLISFALVQNDLKKVKRANTFFLDTSQLREIFIIMMSKERQFVRR